MLLKNVKLMWACVNNRNPLSEKFQIDCVELSPAQVKALEDEGVTVNDCDREENNRGKFVTMKSDYPPDVVDAGKKPFDGEIGNGSICHISWNPYAWKFKSKKGVSAGVKGIQVIELVKYKGSGGVDEFEDESAGVVGNDVPEDDIPF